MSSTGPGAPPCKGPFSAPIAPTTDETRSEPVDAITRAAQVEQQRARSLIRSLVSAVCLPHAPQRLGRAQKLPSVAQQVFFAFTGRKPSRPQQALVDRCLVLSADHELNASAFAARIAAGAGADLHSCVTAALATLSGPRHGGACDRVEALMVEVLSSGPQQAMNARLARGEDLLGFDAGAYPEGDPRTLPLLDGARRLSKNSALKVLLELVAQVKQHLGEAAAVDLGLVAAALALGFPPGAAAGLFATGRTGRLGRPCAQAARQRSADSSAGPLRWALMELEPRCDWWHQGIKNNML